MKIIMRIGVAFGLFFVSLVVSASGAGVGLGHSSDRFFYGGGIGASFGDVDVVSISPTLGVFLNDKASVGVGLAYRASA